MLWCSSVLNIVRQFIRVGRKDKMLCIEKGYCESVNVLGIYVNKLSPRLVDAGFIWLHS